MDKNAEIVGDPITRIPKAPSIPSRDGAHRATEREGAAAGCERLDFTRHKRAYSGQHLLRKKVCLPLRYRNLILKQRRLLLALPSEPLGHACIPENNDSNRE